MASLASAIALSYRANLYTAPPDQSASFEDLTRSESPTKKSVLNLNAIDSPKSPHLSPKSSHEKLSAGHSSTLDSTSTNSSPQVHEQQTTLRSLLLEPDMEDITTLWPRTLDLLDGDLADDDLSPT